MISVRKLKEKLGIPIRDRKASVVKEQPPKQEQAPPDPNEFNQATREILSVVNSFLKQNHRNDPKVLFREMDKDGDGVVDLPEFLHYF